VSYTTFTVTVSNPGSGNKFFINGVQQATVELAYGATYRFDQSDSSNATHPLRFSSDSGESTPYTTGVTINGTQGNVGAYTQIVVDNSAPSPIYYHCHTHAGMGGSANISSNSWGALQWGQDSWGDQGNATILTSSVAISSSIGSSTTQANANVVVSGIAASYTLSGAVAGASADVSPTGMSLTTAIGTSASGIGANAIGSLISSTINSVTIDADFLIGSGWGRDTWGSMVWGDNYSVQLQGISLSAVTGNEDAFTDVVVSITGIALQQVITPVGTSANYDHEIAHSFLLGTVINDVSIEGHSLVELTGIGLSYTLEDVEASPKMEVDVTGVSLQTSLGDEDITGDGFIELTGIGSTYTIGNSTLVSGYDVTGISATYAAPGNVVVIGGSTVVPTGIGLTITVVNPNIIAWAEVDVGTPVVWTPVDLAA
tara:strand:- start:7 stop:1293 length:1287 start_codon:yes stop_codon:yes gene_type:complete